MISCGYCKKLCFSRLQYTTSYNVLLVYSHLTLELDRLTYLTGIAHQEINSLKIMIRRSLIYPPPSILYVNGLRLRPAGKKRACREKRELAGSLQAARERGFKMGRSVGGKIQLV